MAVSEQQTVPDRTDGGSDLPFAAGLGFYLGVIVASWSGIGGLLAGASTGVILVTTPSTVTIVLLATLVVGDRFATVPARIGSSRWRQAGWFLPPIGFVAMLAVPAVTPIAYTGRVTVVSIAAAAVSGLVAVGLTEQCRSRYVDAVTPDEPTATWPWQKTGVAHSGGGVAVAMLCLAVLGLGMVALGNWFGLFWVGYGLLMTFLMWPNTDSEWFDTQPRWNPPELRVHEAGLVVDKPFTTTIVPWDAIDGVELTDDELRLERRWLDIRCDRAVIEDPETVLEAIERARQ